MTKEFSYDSTYHTIEECKSNDSLNKHSKSVSNLCKTSDKLSEELKEIKEDKKSLLKKIEDFKEEERKEEKKKEKELKELKQGKETGGAADVEKMNADFSQSGKYNVYVKINEELNKNNPNARELANIFLVKPKNAPESKEYKYLEPNYAETVNSQYELTGTNKEIGNNWSGFVYYKDSALATDVSNSEEAQKQIKERFNNITKEFKTNKIGLSFLDTDLHLALGHATILNPHIDKNGYFHGVLFDKYDFDPMYKSAYKKPFIYAANNYFWYLQERDRNRNFYILAPVSFKW